LIAKFEEVLTFVKEKHREARDGSEKIVFRQEQFALTENMKAAGSGHIRAEAPSIADLPQYEVLKHSNGLSAWAVILAVDMRGSSRRAVEIGAEDTFITMHTFLPTMAHLVEKADGKVVGLRGDGLFAAFGVTELTGSGFEVDPEVAGDAARNAVTCGKAMIEAVEDAINPVLVADSIRGEIAIGVGASVGDVVITRIGWETASELTVYGAPVNQACKELAASSNRNNIRITKGLRNIYPKGEGGKVSFNWLSGCFTVKFPSDMHMLERSSSALTRKNPK
jgi:class 3 adenylate cyclase